MWGGVLTAPSSLLLSSPPAPSEWQGCLARRHGVWERRALPWTGSRDWSSGFKATGTPRGLRSILSSSHLHALLREMPPTQGHSRSGATLRQ